MISYRLNKPADAGAIVEIHSETAYVAVAFAGIGESFGRVGRIVEALRSKSSRCALVLLPAP